MAGRPARALTALLALLLVGVLAPASAAWSRVPPPVEDYAGYQPQTRCAPKPKPGTLAVARFLTRHYEQTSIVELRRACSVGGTSEHKEGRALDWGVSVRSAADRAAVRSFLDALFRTDKRGNPHAKARRMGVMYVIWSDHIYASYDRFARRDYLSSSCRNRRTCSDNLRHRTHLHLSLSRAGGRGDTSWYARR